MAADRIPDCLFPLITASLRSLAWAMPGALLRARWRATACSRTRRRSSLFIGAAGAGAVAEVLAAGSNAILISRLLVDAAEQEIHAARLAARGLVRTRSRSEVCARGRADLVAEALAEPIKPNAGDLLGGPARYRELLLDQAH